MGSRRTLKALLFVKVFVWTLAPLAVLFGGLGAVGGIIWAEGSQPPFNHWRGAAIGWGLGLAAAASIALAMAITMTWTQLYMGGDPRVRHRCRLVLAAPLEIVERHCFEALVQCGAKPRLLRSPERVVVSGKTGFSFKSFGEKVRCTINSQGLEQTIDVESQPLWPTTLVDYGMNLENVRGIAEYLAQHGASHVVLPE